MDFKNYLYKLKDYLGSLSGLAMATIILLIPLSMLLDLTNFTAGFFSGSLYLDKGVGSIIFLIIVILTGLAILKFEPEKSAGIFLWGGIILMLAGVEVVDETIGGWFFGNAIKFLGLPMAVTGHYFIYQNAYNKGLMKRRLWK